VRVPAAQVVRQWCLTLVRVRVFLSSTYQDLVDEREAVYERLRLDGHEVVRMEDFGSRDEVPLETCLEAVESCRLYVLLLGSRYGTIEPQYNLSYTNIEYERACELEMWVLAYVSREIAMLRGGERELDEQEQEDLLRLEDFHATIERSHTIRRPYFESASELAEHVAVDVQALGAKIRVRPSLGRRPRNIQHVRSYAGRAVRYTRLRSRPLVVVVADLAVLTAETYPEGRGRRMRDKVRGIVEFLEHEGANAVVFNEIPATGAGAIVDQRAQEAKETADVLVVLIHGRSDAENLRLFLDGDGRVAVWYPDHIDAPEIEGVRVAPYTQVELQRCQLAINVQRYLDGVIDEHLAQYLR
jgi:hypothetical protein